MARKCQPRLAGAHFATRALLTTSTDRAEPNPKMVTGLAAFLRGGASSPLVGGLEAGVVTVLKDDLPMARELRPRKLIRCIGLHLHKVSCTLPLKKN